MTPELASLPTLIPPALADFLSLARAQGFTPILVGGAVRDLLLGLDQITDWDFELHHPQGNESRWQALLSALRLHVRLTPQAHHVVKAFHHDSKTEWQFAPPRTETYPVRDAYGHGDFDAKVAWKLSFAEAVLRRDFTVNALGAEFSGSDWKLLDPLNGAEHVKQGLLQACDREHFRKDPVRFLRAHRFALRFNWQFTSELQETLEQMDLSLLTAHYMGEEARKSGRPFTFWNRLQHQPTLPTKFQGGLLEPQGLELTYHEHLAGVGHSNACLAAVFAHGEGWHVLLAMAGKGESETTSWRHRRDYILQIARKRPEDFIDVFEVVSQKPHFQALCQLTRPPHVWLQYPWVKAVLAEHELLWIAEKAWDDKLDVRQFPPQERGGRKVLAWLNS